MESELVGKMFKEELSLIDMPLFIIKKMDKPMNHSKDY
jgi:hypothetical protein